MTSAFEEITISENYKLDRPEYIDRTKIKSDYVAYRPHSNHVLNTLSPFTIHIPREEGYADLRDSYLQIEARILQDDDDPYQDGDLIQPLNLFGIALWWKMELSSFGSKKLESIDNVYIASLVYKLLSDNQQSMYSFYIKDKNDTDFDDKRLRMLEYTIEKGTIFVRVYLRDVFGFVRHLDKINFGLGYKLTLTRAPPGYSVFNIMDQLLPLPPEPETKITIKDLALYVRRDTPSLENIALVKEHILAKKVTNYSYVAVSTTTKTITGGGRWMMDIEVEDGANVPIYVMVVFQSADKAGGNRKHNNGIFDTLDIIEAWCDVGNIRYPDTPYQTDIPRNKYDDPYSEVVRFYKEYIKGEGMPMIDFFEWRNLYNIWVFDIRSHRYSTSPKTITPVFRFRADPPAGTVATAVVLTQKLASVSSDGQHQLDVI